MPTDHGFRRDDDESLFPSRPESTNDNSEELVEQTYLCSDGDAEVSAQHSELLPEHEILQYKVPTATEEANQCSDPEEKEAEHVTDLYQINDWKYCCKLLILRSARVLARDSDLIRQLYRQSVIWTTPLKRGSSFC